ncbi:YqeG family HAD IIIA-type phosphatase [Bombilactobacillus bombi]|uniref:YqeG family HAD IIIA-type phosphatase n=1 Tax=Bombilactobacillus bombi TaxID=1303590 RepID=A0A417ZE94_9LACO|nr:YqeG family HAD IIIA-type phosphatase [Bombilactobacillus bombi]RHW49588.1 YqeG family HAD IIIA-type phosphatase [Bombilactobacillus bombi]
MKPAVMITQIMQVDPQEFVDQGIKVILSDLDNTLVPWNQKQRLDQRLLDWNQKLKAHDIELVIVSNNNEQRVLLAVQGLAVKVVARALKPLPFAMKRYLRSNHVSTNEVVMVGDQLLTDVLAGNLAGIRTILVKPLVPTDSKKTRINRLIERPLMWINSRLYPQLKWRKHLHE